MVVAGSHCPLVRAKFCGTHADFRPRYITLAMTPSQETCHDNTTGVRIGEASHPGPAAAKATARRRQQKQQQNNLGQIINLLLPLLTQLLQVLDTGRATDSSSIPSLTTALGTLLGHNNAQSQDTPGKPASHRPRKRRGTIYQQTRQHTGGPTTASTAAPKGGSTSTTVQPAAAARRIQLNDQEWPSFKDGKGKTAPGQQKGKGPSTPGPQGTRGPHNPPAALPDGSKPEEWTTITRRRPNLDAWALRPKDWSDPTLHYDTLATALQKHSGDQPFRAVIHCSDHEQGQAAAAMLATSSNELSGSFGDKQTAQPASLGNAATSRYYKKWPA